MRGGSGEVGGSAGRRWSPGFAGVGRDRPPRPSYGLIPARIGICSMLNANTGSEQCCSDWKGQATVARPSRSGEVVQGRWRAKGGRVRGWRESSPSREALAVLEFDAEGLRRRIRGGVASDSRTELGVGAERTAGVDLLHLAMLLWHSVAGEGC